MSWESIENALRLWVKSATGLGDDAIYFAHQGNPRPAPALISILLEDISPVGIDETLEDTNLNRDAGEEVRTTTRGLREFGVLIQAATTPAAGNATARAYLGTVQLAARSLTNLARFDAVEISVFDVGKVITIPKVYETATEGRAQLACRFYTNLELEEYCGYIATVEVTGHVETDGDIVILPMTIPA